MKTNTDKIETKVIVKKKYSRPVLIAYGKLSELTATGSGLSNEGSMIDAAKHP